MFFALFEKCVRHIRNYENYCLSLETKSFHDYRQGTVVLQALNTEDLEDCEFSKKFRAKSSGDMKKSMGCVGH